MELYFFSQQTTREKKTGYEANMAESKREQALQVGKRILLALGPMTSDQIDIIAVFVFN